MGEALAARPGRVLPSGSARRREATAPSVLRRALRAVRTHPVTSAGAVLVCVAAGAVSWNALAVQTRPHPAPLFASKTAAPPAPRLGAPPQARPSAAPSTSPPVAPVARTPPRDVPDEVTRSIEPAPAVRPAPIRMANARDPIGEVLRSEAAAGLQRPDGSKEVVAAQRTLARLGYGPIKPDGVMGSATRQAIERFERDRRLPVTGELGPRTLRLLASQAGASVE